MLITHWAFVAPLVLKYKQLGITQNGLRDLPGFIYFWKIIGHLLGMHDK